MSDKRPVTFAMESTGASAAQTRILLDGQDISRHVAAVHLRCVAGESLTKVYLEMVPFAGVSVELPAEVVVAPAVPKVVDGWMDVTAVGEPLKRHQRKRPK